MSAFCDTCQKSFYSKQTLQRHRLKAHADTAAQAGRGVTSKKDNDYVEESDDEQTDDRETDNDSYGDDGDATDQDIDEETAAADILNIVKGAIAAKELIDTAAWKKVNKIVEKTLNNVDNDDDA